MRYNRLLLVSAPVTSKHGGLRVPAGIGYIAQALHDNGIEYDYLDMRIDGAFRTLKERALRLQPDLIGFSMCTLGYRKTYDMISRVKELLPGTKFAVGGHHPTILKEKILEQCPAIDFAVIADGEKTMVELCSDTLPYGEIAGLVYREWEKITFTGERPLVRNLDEYAFPRYSKFEMAKYSRQIPVHSSRGCVHACIFCPNKLLARNYRKRSVGHFVDELEYWYGQGIRQFAIDDDNFSFDKGRVLNICDEIEKRGMKDLFIRCSNGLRADSVDRELLGRLKEVGVREVGYGVDGGNNKMLGVLRKGESIETIEEAVKTACELRIDVKLFFMVGSPQETKEDIADSIRLARKYPITKVSFNNPIPYPGTELFDYVTEHNLFLIPPAIYLNTMTEDDNVPLFETKELPAADREKVLRQCRKIEDEVMKDAVYRMFRRYPLLAGLIRHVFVVSLFEKLFFGNLFFRNLFEKIRYRSLLGRENASQ